MEKNPETPTPKKVQFGLNKFFGSPEEKKAAQPALSSQSSSGYKKRKKSQYELDWEAERAQYIEELAQKDAELAQSQSELVNAAAKRRKLMGELRYSHKRSTSATKMPNTNRKLPGSEIRRLEVSVQTKLKYAQEMEEAQKFFSTKREFWSAMSERYGLTVAQLQAIKNKKEVWKGLTSKPLRQKRKAEPQKRKRAAGGGRKIAQPDIISSMKTWLSMERSCGHTISKQDLLDEYLARLQSTSDKLAQAAEDPKLSQLQKAELLLDSKERSEKKAKLLKSHNYRKTQKNRLVAWLGAKYMTSQLVSTISPVEEAVRLKLSWQAFDRALWLSKETLSSVVASPADFVTQRQHLVIGFSDQVPLWAKATGRRAVFAEEEITPAELKKNFSQVRAAIQEVLHSDTHMLVQPIEGRTQKPVARKLSFSSAASPEKTSAPSSEITSVVALPDEDSQPTENAAEEEKKVEESPPSEALLRASLTTKGVSGDERFRITYEARQLLTNIYGSSDTEIIGQVWKGLLVVPGQWARLSNISANGTWLKTESFQVADKVITHTQGEKVGRILAAYRKLRASDPHLFTSVEVMSQPAANVDSVILSWSIESQAEAFPCSVWQRDCFSSVFGEAAEKGMFLAQQISCLVAEKCTSKIQITDTDFSKQFKALVRQKLQQLRSEWKDRPKGDSDTWIVGAKEILTSVVHAQNFMSEKNLSDNWVLKAAVRNGILAYRPNPGTGKLEELLSQPWAQKAELAFGSKRYPGQTLEKTHLEGFRRSASGARLEP